MSLTAAGGNITVKGSETMVNLAQKWAESYMAKHPGIRVQIAGDGSGVGYSALHKKTADLVNASRQINSEESTACIEAFGKRPTEYKVALDGLSIYVNGSNPLKDLTLAQLKSIFTGKIRSWKAVGGPDVPITVYSREQSSSAYEFFREHVLQGADFAAGAQTVPGTAAVLQAVALDKNGIGYGGAACSTGARPLGIKKDGNSPAIEPTEENVVKGAYPIWRYLYIYVNPELDKGEIGTYLNWIRSDEGQKIVKDAGYFPLPKNLRE